MTCIVGHVRDGKVYIGGDSAGSDGQCIKSRKDEKVFIKGDMAFGFTSSFRMGQILRYSFVIPEHGPKKDNFEYLCSDFIDALIDCFTSKGYARIDNNEIEGGQFMLGYKGKLYFIDSDFHVAEASGDYDACGSGEPYALGAMMATDNPIPELAIIKALMVAEFYCPSVRGPFNIVSI